MKPAGISGHCRDKVKRRPCPRLQGWLAASILAFVIMVPAVGSTESDDGGNCAPPELVNRLIGWIGRHTDYDVAPALADPPEVCCCQTGEEIEYEGEHLIVEPNLFAVFDSEARRIFLVEPWHASDARNVSALLHELIHDIQLASRDRGCVGAPEWEAYKLQDAWLAEHGIESEFNWLHVFFLSRCPRDIHP